MTFLRRPLSRYPLAMSAVAAATAIAMAAGCSSSLEYDAGNDNETAALQQALSMTKVLTYAMGAGLDCDGNLITAGAIAMAESSLIPDNVGTNPPTAGCPNGSSDYGIWQISHCYHPSYSLACLKDPACNAKAMADVSSGGTNWQPWSSWTSGRYKNFVAAATTGYRTVCSSALGSGGASGTTGSTDATGSTGDTTGSSTSGVSGSSTTSTSGCAGVPDGTYCGDHSGLNRDPSVLYTCANGAIASSQSCSSGCTTNAAVGYDSCYSPSCAGLNDGAYCGNDGIQGNPSTLFRCVSGSIVSATPCGSICTVYEPVGYDDACE